MACSVRRGRWASWDHADAGSSPPSSDTHARAFCLPGGLGLWTGPPEVLAQPRGPHPPPGRAGMSSFGVLPYRSLGAGGPPFPHLPQHYCLAYSLAFMPHMWGQEPDALCVRLAAIPSCRIWGEEGTGGRARGTLPCTIE